MLLPSSVSSFRALILRAISLRPFVRHRLGFSLGMYPRGFFLFFESVLAFFALGGTAASPSRGSEPCHSRLTQLLAVSHHQVLVRAACFILSDSPSRRLRLPCQCPRGEGLSERLAAGRLQAPPSLALLSSLLVVCRRAGGARTARWSLSLSCCFCAGFLSFTHCVRTPQPAFWVFYRKLFCI